MYSWFSSPIENSFLYVKIIIFGITIPLFFISFILTSITEGKEIPDEYPWLIQFLRENQDNPQQQIESLAIEIFHKKEELFKNRNRLYLSKPMNQGVQSSLNSSIASINSIQYLLI